MSRDEQNEIPQRKRSNNEERTPLEKMNRKLNVGIAIVSACIILITSIILMNRPEAPDVSTVEQQAETAPSEQPTDEATPTPAPINEEATPSTDEEGNTIQQSADANVVEVWTNEAWQPYPTAQTGSHTSVFEKGHIDYEEKLAAAFSVLPIEQQNSIVTSARNNGDAKSARIVVTTVEKTENYRVIIQWIDGEGWLPTSVDVLYNVDGVR